MNAPALTLSAGFAFLGGLLLALLVRSGWRWQVKAAAILITAGGTVAMFLALEETLGLPTRGALPAAFVLHAGVVEEPDPRDLTRRGAIYLWVSPKPDPLSAPAPPRAHAFPYSRDLHEEVAEALGRLKDGVPIEGRAAPLPASAGFRTRAAGVQLFEAPRRALPPKD
jgi:hypothetical protein